MQRLAFDFDCLKESNRITGGKSFLSNVILATPLQQLLNGAPHAN